MKSLLFILNPTAGGGTASELEDILERSMTSYDLDYEIVLTSRPKEAIELAESSDREYLIAVGGDGTINEVAQGIINRGHGILGIIPAGTGNDLSRSLGVPLGLEEALENIINCQPRDLNICKANGEYFLNIASIGFDAEVVANADKIKTKFKSNLAYLLSVFYTLMKYKRKNVSIEIDGVKSNQSIVLMAIGNGSYYGGGIKIMPQASFDDGYLHSCLIFDASNLTILFLLPTILNGSHLKLHKYVRTIKAKSINIKSDEAMYFNLDGEILDGGKEIDIQISEKKISVIYSCKH